MWEIQFTHPHTMLAKSTQRVPPRSWWTEDCKAPLPDLQAIIKGGFRDPWLQLSWVTMYIPLHIINVFCAKVFIQRYWNEIGAPSSNITGPFVWNMTFLKISSWLAHCSKHPKKLRWVVCFWHLFFGGICLIDKLNVNSTIYEIKFKT